MFVLFNESETFGPLSQRLYLLHFFWLQVRTNPQHEGISLTLMAYTEEFFSGIYTVA